MKPKLLIIAQVPPPYHGSNVMADFMLKSLEKKSYKTIFVNKSFSKSIDEIGHFSLRKALRAIILFFNIMLNCLIHQPKLCIYFVACNKLPFIVDAFATYILRLCSIPYILDFHGKGFRKLCNESPLLKRLVSLTLSNAFGGMVRSDSLKSDVNMFIPNEILVTLPNAIPDRPLANEKKKKEFVQVLFLSALAPSKGPLEFLKAATITVQNMSGIRFIIAGPDSPQPSFTEKLKNYIADHNLSRYVKMIGGIYGEEKEKLFDSSDIFVFPTHHETFGLVNIEAMRAGLPVISSSEGAIPEIIINEVTGFIIDPKSPEQIADKIMLLAKDTELSRKMGLSGRKVFESKFSLKVYAENLEKALQFFLNRLNN